MTQSMKQGVKKLLCLVIAFAMVVPMSFTTVKANQAIKVFLDGNELAYDVPASIISAHTMVPIGQTITYLTGQIAAWDATTKTMTFTANGNTITHKVGQNVIYINGVAQAYDTPSLIVDGRTLVPVRMLADATGCQISWDAVNKYVIMTSGGKGNGGNVTANPSVLSVATDKSNINAGETVTLTVTTTAATSRVRLANQNDSSDTLETSESYLAANNQKVFTIKWPVKSTGAVSARIYAGTEAGFTQEYKTVSISSSQAGVSIVDVNVSTKHPEKGKECTVQVVASNTAQKAWLYLQSEGDMASVDTYKVDNSGRRIFTIKWTPKITGSKTVTAYVQDASGNKDFKKFDVYIAGSSAADVQILSYTASPTQAHTGERVDISVTTNTSAEYVWYVYNGYTSSKDYDYYTSSNRRTFDTTMTADGNYGSDNVLHIYAADKDGNKDHKTIKLSIVDYDDDNPNIYSIDPRSTEINLGDNDRIEITTSSDITDVYMTDSDGLDYNATYYSSGGSTKIFRLDYSPYSAGQKRLNFTAENGYGHKATKSVSINVRGGDEKPQIESVDVPSPIYVGDRATLQVYMPMQSTTPNISLSGGYSYSVGAADVGAGQMVVPVDVYFTDEGTFSITVTASNSSGSASKSVRVHVEDYGPYYGDDDNDTYN